MKPEEDRPEEKREERAEDEEEGRPEDPEMEEPEDSPPDDLPEEDHPMEAGKDAKRPPREEENPRTTGPPPNTPRARDHIGGRGGANR